MNFAKKIGLAILISLSFNLAWSQPKIDEKVLAEEANGLFMAYEYEEAYAKYSQLVSLYGSNPMYTFRFGASSIFVTVDRDKSLVFMRDAIRRGYQDPETHYFLAKALHLNYKFAEALQEYEAYESTADKKVLNKSDVKSQIESCKSGINLLSSIKDIQVLEKIQAEKATFFRFYNVDESIGKIITTPDELKSSLDKKAKEPYIIFQAQKSKLIFFASKGKDGTTGKDIYVTQRINGAFSTPEKVKGDINTNQDEDYAFLHPNGKTLYFASKGHGSMGGYDIFRSEFDSTLNQFGPAINLDFAINTPDDDLLFITDADNKIAFFASSRFTSSKNLNVYRVAVDGIPMQITYIKGFLTDLMGLPSKSTHIEIIDQSTGRKVIDTRGNEQDGNFLLFIPKPGTYTYRIQLPGSPQQHEVTVEIPNMDSKLVFKQELKATKDGGREKVEILCHWNDPLQEDIASLTQMMLLTKANLEVNTTEIITTNSTAATNTANETNWNNAQKILTEVNENNSLLEKQVAELKETNETLVALIQQSLSVVDEAQEKLSSLQITSDTENAEDMEALAVAKQELKIANEQTQALGKSLILNRKDIDQSSSSLSQGKTISKSLTEKISTQNTVGLQEDLKKANELQVSKSNSNNSEQITKTRKVTEEELNALQSELISIQEEEVKNELQLKIEKENLANTKKKKEIEAIQEKIKQLENLDIELAEDAEKVSKKIETKSNELSLLTQQEKIELQVESNTLPKPLPEFRQSGKSVNQELLFKELEEANALAIQSIQRASNVINKTSTAFVDSKSTTENSTNSNNSSSSNSTSNNTTSNNTTSNNTTSNNTTSNNTSSNNTASNNTTSNNTTSNNTTDNSSNTNTTTNSNTNSTSNNNNTSDNSSNTNTTTNSNTNSTSNNSSIDTAGAFESAYKSALDPNPSIASTEAYEKFDLLPRIEAQNIPIENKQKLIEIQSEIESIQMKMKGTSNVRDLKKMDKKLEELVLSRSLEEEKIQSQIITLTGYDLDDTQFKIDSLLSLPHTPDSIKNTVHAQQLRQESVLEEANDLRRAAVSQTDPIERADTYRRAFALETEVIEENKKISSFLEASQPYFEETKSQNTNVTLISSNNTNSNNTTSNNTTSNNTASSNSTSNNTTSNNTTSNNTTSNNTSSNNTSSNNTTSNNTSSNNTTSNNTTSNNTTSNNTTSNNTSSNNTSSNNTSSNNTTSNNTTSNISENNFTGERETTIPELISSTLFGTLENNSIKVHNESNPIPTLTKIPDGAFYTIQVGAFRRPVPNNTFTQFSPVYAEQQSNGFIRYSSGFFVAYGEAKTARDAIRAMGYKDAFIVAYKNGKRVGYTALMNEQELITYNSGQANNSNNSNSTNSNSTEPSSINTTYYNQEIGTAANLIETSSGVFFTVQVGVYTKPTKNAILEALPALHVELMKNGNIRYLAGNFKSLQDALNLKNELRNGNVPDAFITAYENGNRITISEAKLKLGIAQ